MNLQAARSLFGASGHLTRILHQEVTLTVSCCVQLGVHGVDPKIPYKYILRPLK